jgi:predicted nucleic acid-binding protein
VTHPRRVVLDASAATKLFCDEPGGSTVREIMRLHTQGELVIAVDHLCVYEVLRAVSRKHDAAKAKHAFDLLRRADVEAHPPTASLVDAAFEQADALGCVLYDAFAAGLASLLGATLCSADRKAHAAFPGVVLVDTDDGEP